MFSKIWDALFPDTSALIVNNRSCKRFRRHIGISFKHTPTIYNNTNKSKNKNKNQRKSGGVRVVSASAQSMTDQIEIVTYDFIKQFFFAFLLLVAVFSDFMFCQWLTVYFADNAISV